MSEHAADYGAPDFDRLARESIYSRQEWERAWALRDQRVPWRAVLDLVPLNTPTNAALMLSGALIPPASPEDPR